MLAYALLERGESAAEALAFEPKSEAFAVAFAAVFSREGKTSDTEKVLAASEYVSAQMRPAMIGYAVSAKNADVADALLLLAAKADTPARSAFLVGALAKFDLSQFVPKLFAGFDAAAAETKLSALKTAETIATPEVFSTVAKLLPTLDAKLGRAAVKVLLKCSSADFTPQMLSETVAAYGECKPAVKRNLVRFGGVRLLRSRGRFHETRVYRRIPLRGCKNFRAVEEPVGVCAACGNRENGEDRRREI